MRNGFAQKRQLTRAWIVLIALILLLFALIAGFVCLLRGNNDSPPPDPVQPVVDPIEDVPRTNRWGTMLPGLDKNEYDSASFSTIGDRIRYETADGLALTGIDVSSHNGEIDWSMVAADGIDYAILQIGFRGYKNGALAEDETFRQNAEGAKEHNVALGVYFFSQCLNVKEAEEEARYVLQLLDGMALEWPIYFDWEPIEAQARTDEMDPSLLTDCAKAFCQIVEQAGYKGGIYFNQEYGYLHYNLLDLQEYDFWLAEYAASPSFYYHFNQWQYSCTGTVAGISTMTDLNLSFCDYRRE